MLFLVAEQLYVWSCLSVCLFVCLSVCPKFLSQILSQISVPNYCLRFYSQTTRGFVQSKSPASLSVYKCTVRVYSVVQLGPSELAFKTRFAFNERGISPKHKEIKRLTKKEIKRKFSLQFPPVESGCHGQGQLC